MRDYIHITDLAQGHIAALDYFEKLVDTNYEVFNLGGGQGYSVFEVIKTFEKYLGKKLDYQIAPRRPGDMARLVAKADKALKYLNW